jgi:DNA-binding NarL/FixJ family response regulator
VQCDVLLTDQFSAKTSAENFLFRDQWANLQGEILLLGMEEDQELFLAAVRAGATGCLLKDALAGEFAPSRAEKRCALRNYLCGLSSGSR